MDQKQSVLGQVDVPVRSGLTEQGLDEDEVIGYVEPWVASPGQVVEVKVSSTVPKLTWSLVRLIQCFEHPKAPPCLREEIYTPRGEEATVAGVFQKSNPGSYALINSWKRLQSRASGVQGVRCSVFVQPWLLDAGHDQVLLSTLDITAATGFALVMASTGELAVHVGDTKAVHTYSTGILLRRLRWAQVTLEVTSAACKLLVHHWMYSVEKTPEPQTFQVQLDLGAVAGGSSPLTLAAGFFHDGLATSSVASSVFNGRLDSPHIEVSHDMVTYQTWARYDFSADISSDSITDVSGSARHGVLVNAPTRAVKGYNWDGSEPDWTKAKYGYGAIHFHEDDLDDAGWDTTFTVTIPHDTPSGAYAVCVRGEEGTGAEVEDDITFFVRPAQGPQQKRPKAAIVLSTFTYLAYANERMYDESLASRLELPAGIDIRQDHHFRRMVRRTDLGLSLYDTHRDGSGAVFSSYRRPILNIRPTYVNWAFYRPRELSADQLMLGFLERTLGRGGYDVLTDHDLHHHADGSAELLADYDVVITGSHPEYPSLRILDAYATYAREGGHIMYLGGNGFYWTTVSDGARPHRMEVRRGDQGCRSFGLPAGERVHSLTGEQGGLWRARGRSPQSLFGVGSCACGNGQGVPYRVTEDAAGSPELAWLWEGLARSETDSLPLIGTEGFGGGASGDEIDRLDFDLGTPINTVLLATSTGHDDSFVVFNEELMFPPLNALGTVSDKVRSDMIYYETSGGGAVFSVGSINWYCSLGWEAYENSVATITGNVLKEFLRRGKQGSGRS